MNFTEYRIRVILLLKMSTQTGQNYGGAECRYGRMLEKFKSSISIQNGILQTFSKGIRV